MSYKTLPKKQISKVIRKWMKQYEVIAPRKNQKDIKFEVISDCEEVILNADEKTIYPPKSFFLPQSETLFSCQSGRCRTVELNSKQRILLGARPCDTKAFWLLDHIFMEKSAEDLYWANHRDRTLVISFACKSPRDSCFCTSVGGSPFSTQGSDIQIIEIDEDYLFESVTERGAKLIADLPQAPKDVVNKVPRIMEESIGKIKKQFNAADLNSKLYALFEDNFWKEISQSCLGCGVCTFLCPTCFCFDIVDEVLRGERVRNWDTCMFKIYSQEASGYNPRPTKAERTRQRVMHKFAYWEDAINEFGCTGCGRCVVHCPVNLDIRQIVREAQARKLKAGVGT